MWFWSTPRPGDWVRSTRRVPVGVLDQLTGGGLPPGTRGVVVGTAPGLLCSDLLVAYDAGLAGTVTARTRARDLRTVRRGGGVDEFRRSRGRLAAARAGVAAVFVAPVLWFAIQYVVERRSTDGLMSTLVVGSVYGAFDFVGFLVAEPLRAIAYLLVTSVAWRFAFRR